MVHIPIVMATDNNYIPLVASLTSLLENAETNTFYDINILIDDFFTEESKKITEMCLRGYRDHFSLAFLGVGYAFDEVMLRVPHITRPTYYRLIIPDLLEIDKCIYLDTDTIILSDLQMLYDISLGDCYVAGVWHPSVAADGWEQILTSLIGLTSADQYVNAGVLVMNLEQMRRDGMVDKFMALLPRNMPNQDQDIINYACYGKIKLISFRYNVLTKVAGKSIEDYNGGYSAEELWEAWNAPAIIHYANPDKPWNSGNGVFIDIWWKFFKKTPIYHMWINDFVNEFILHTIYGSRQGSVFTKEVPQIYDIAYKREYVVYGAGKRGRDVIGFMKRENVLPDFIVVSDISGNPSDIEGIKVRDINEAEDQLTGKTIVIAVRESWQKEIIMNLQKYDYRELLPISDFFLC